MNAQRGTALNTPRTLQRPTFYQWLRSIANGASARNRTGKVARWAVGDSCFPVRSRTLEHVLIHMRQSHARTAGAPDELAFRAAFREYKEFVSSGGSVPGGRQRKDTVHRGYLLPRSTPVQVRELAAHESRSTGQKVSQGSVIARLVAAKHEATFGRS